MFKKIFTLSLLLSVFLAACQSAATSPTALPVAEEDAGQTPATDSPALPEVSPTPSTGEAEVQGESTCTVVSRQPTPGPTEESIVPPVSASDWVHGPEDAKVTIIEYGDFQ